MWLPDEPTAATLQLLRADNLGGAKLLSERIVSALGSMQLERVVIGLEATSIYGDSLVYALR